jgi:hypothetical protein
VNQWLRQRKHIRAYQNTAGSENLGEKLCRQLPSTFCPSILAIAVACWSAITVCTIVVCLGLDTRMNCVLHRWSHQNYGALSAMTLTVELPVAPATILHRRLLAMMRQHAELTLALSSHRLSHRRRRQIFTRLLKLDEAIVTARASIKKGIIG